MSDGSAAEPDEVLWRAWEAMDLPEGCRGEVVEGAIEISAVGSLRHGVLLNRLCRALDGHLTGQGHQVWAGVIVLHGRKAWQPDLVVAPIDMEAVGDEDGYGITASGVRTVIEVVSPGRQNTQRDRVRKRREYARAGIPVYVLVDDFDGDGAVVVLTSPDPAKAAYTDEHRVPYGKDAVVPSGPAEGFVIGSDLTGA
ncbi:Uma2 family endonuclease [Streptomyces cremeus]|uniref:Uma2 family endonuclease n=1 Tax=Streptomyces cremeus TaxID=66881 RepID=A0ABV5PA43_STRCM